MSGRGAQAGKPLSPRHIQVLAGVAAGLRMQDIADQLGISPWTVKTHLCRAYARLGANSGTHAVVLAYRLGHLREEPQ